MTGIPPAIVLTGVDPSKLVSANRKLHHQHAGTVRRYWRALAHQHALMAYGQAEEGYAWHLRARIIITVRWPDRRRHDVGNLYSYVAKPIVDGLVDARVLPDDDDIHLIGPDLRRDHERGPLQLSVFVLDMSADPTLPAPVPAANPHTAGTGTKAGA